MRSQRMSSPIIELVDVSKKFTLLPFKPTLMETISRGFRKHEFTALANINLQIYPGDRVGIMGPNGSGKSTLLKIISGITRQTTGKVIVRGRAVSLIELAAGMHPDQTGLENIWLNGMLVGMSKHEIKNKIDHIVYYADIGAFINQPVYMYSEGMLLRLAISIAFAKDADIYVFDENLFVADAAFTKKMFATLKSSAYKNKSFLIASHNIYGLKDLCKKTIFMDHGSIVGVR
jgi:ABC-type polysaccharide/polyol phosphate transport system ATPase subunit